MMQHKKVASQLKPQTGASCRGDGGNTGNRHSLPDVTHPVAAPALIFRPPNLPRPEGTSNSQSKDTVLAHNRQMSSLLVDNMGNVISFSPDRGGASGAGWSSSCHSLRMATEHKNLVKDSRMAAPSPSSDCMMEIQANVSSDDESGSWSTKPDTPPTALPQTGTLLPTRVVLVKKSAIRNQDTTDCDDDCVAEPPPRQIVTGTSATLMYRNALAQREEEKTSKGLQMRRSNANSSHVESTGATSAEAPSDGECMAPKTTTETKTARVAVSEGIALDNSIGDAPNFDRLDSQRKLSIGSFVALDSGGELIPAPIANTSSVSANRSELFVVDCWDPEPLTTNELGCVKTGTLRRDSRDFSGDSTDGCIKSCTNPSIRLKQQQQQHQEQRRVQVVVESKTSGARSKIIDYVSRVKIPTPKLIGSKSSDWPNNKSHSLKGAIRSQVSKIIGQLGVGFELGTQEEPKVDSNLDKAAAAGVAAQVEAVIASTNSNPQAELETPILASTTKSNSYFSFRLNDILANSNIIEAPTDGLANKTLLDHNRESNKMLKSSHQDSASITDKQPQQQGQSQERQMIEEISASVNANPSANKKTVAAGDYPNTNRCAYQRELDDRRSTYCSSVGAMTTTDLNYDSSDSNNFNNHSNNNQIGIVNTRSSNSNMNMSASSNSRRKMQQESGGGSGGGGGDGSKLSFACKIRMVDGGGGGGSNNKMKPLKPRENWANNFEFLLAVIGFAVDLGNVWRFPYICYKNGGGAFLIPYTVMFILGGLPIFYLEMSLGQFFSSGCLTIWKRICPLAKGIGYAMCVLNFFTSLYYNTIISWAVFFFVESFTSVLPWTSCNNKWNSPDCRTIEQRQATRFTPSGSGGLSEISGIDPASMMHANISTPTRDYFEREVLQVHRSHGIDDLGSIRKPLAAYLAIVYVCIYFAIWKGVKSTGKAVWITAILPYFVLIPLLVRGVFLEGAWLGIKYYLYPDWGKIIDVEVWVEAAKQIYFSLGPGFGTLMALSSYNKFHHNCQRDALIAASVNYFASFISGLVIFAVLGYMATIENVSIAEVATEGPGLVFQVYPEGLATMKFSSMWSVLFFIMVITLGIDSTFGGLESVITGLCDEYPHVLRAHRGVFIGLLIIIIYLCSLPTTTYGGNYVIYVLESYGTSLSLLFIVLIETVIVCWLYGADRFCKNLEEMHGTKPGAYWRICWKYISPTILLLIFMAACGQELDKYHILKSGDYTYPSWAPTVGLLMTGSSLCCVPIYAIYYLKTKTSGPLYERLRITCKPIEIDSRDSRSSRDPYAEALNKIRDENDDHRDTII